MLEKKMRKMDMLGVTLVISDFTGKKHIVDITYPEITFPLDLTSAILNPNVLDATFSATENQIYLH